MEKKQIVFGAAVFIVPILVMVLMGHFYYPMKARTTPIPDFAKVSNDQTKYFNAKLDQLLEEVKRVSRAESNHVTAEIRELIQSSTAEVVVNVQDVGDRVSRSEGRMDAMTLNKNYTKVFYPVGQEKLFFKHFPESHYQTFSKELVKNGAVLGHEYSVKRKMNIKNYEDPYSKSYQMQLDPNLPVAHH